ncbi:MAG: hypothetical protein ABFS35_01345 [Bacteroidota bacterium]
MKIRIILTTLFLSILTNSTFSQQGDSLKIDITGVESTELLDFYRFENINYFKINISGKEIKNKYFLLTSNEYWKDKKVKTDTIVYTKRFQLQNEIDTVKIRIMSKKEKSDTVKFQFHLPRFSIIKKFGTTNKDMYSLRVTSNREKLFAKNAPINFLVYSLPYKVPNSPGRFSYCALTREGTPPDEWGAKFGVEHYIVFKFTLIE